jgi:hypothetical protein
MHSPPTSSTTESTQSPPVALPIVTIGSWTGREPAIVYFSGDAGNIATGLTWTWNQTKAVGHGTRDELGCVPNCAEGSATPYPVTLTLTAPVNGAFTSITEVTADGKGTAERFTAPDLGQGACENSNNNSCQF